MSARRHTLSDRPRTLTTDCPIARLHSIVHMSVFLYVLLTSIILPIIAFGIKDKVKLYTRLFMITCQLVHTILSVVDVAFLLLLPPTVPLTTGHF